jgi:hypothetical protein
MTPEAAAVEMCRMLRAASIVREPPAWVTATSNEADHPQAAAWLLIGDAALPLKNRSGELVAMTVMVPGTLAPEYRAYVNQSRRQHRLNRHLYRLAKHGREARKSKLTLKRDHDQEGT